MDTHTVTVGMKRRRGGGEDLSSMTLICLIREERWGEVRERIRTLGNEGLRVEYDWDWNVFHPLGEACCFGAPFDLVRAMLEEGSAAAKFRDSDGCLPLHLACSCGSSTPRVVRLLLDAYPEGVKTANNDGLLPLHFACSNSCTPGVVRLLLDAYPEGAKTADKDGLLPIHELFTVNEVSLETCNMLIDAHPEGVKATDSRGCLPLHWATHTRDIRLGVLRILINAYPEGATIRDGFGNLPLHYFAESRRGDTTTRTRKRVRALLEPILKNKDACQVTNRKGETPLDIEAKFNTLSLHTCVSMECCAPNVIISVARRHPQQLRLMDEGGNFPLHIAASNPSLNGAQATSRGLQLEENASDSNESNEESDEANGDGSEGEQREPGNEECGAGDDVEVSEDLIGALVKLYPEAAAVMNRDQKFPLVLAIESGKRWDEGIETIVDAAKHVSLVKDESANLYPFMIAATVDTPCLTTVYKLLRRCPEVKRYIIT